MDGTVKQMRKNIMAWERGRIFFIDDFASMESQGSVRIALGQLVSEGMIVRVARGIYCYPKIVSGGKSPSPISYSFQGRFRLPDPELIAYALAAKERVRIMPYGDKAAHDLGLTGLVISDHKYLTDGAPRKISLSGGRKIYFFHTSEVKMFDFSNDTMKKISCAIRALGADAIGPEQKRKIHEHLRTVPQWEYDRDIKLPPAWVQDIIRSIWDN